MHPSRAFRASLLAIAAIGAADRAAADPIAIPFPECGLTVELPQHAPADGETVKLRVRGEADACALVSALAGDVSLVRPWTPGLSIVVGVRPAELPPDLSCPAVILPFVLDVRLPESLPAAGPPGLIPVSVFRHEPIGPLGDPNALVHCGAFDLPAPSPGAEETVGLAGRFAARVDWRTPDGASGTGKLVPDSASGTAATFWFFAPGNPELLLKLVDGCAANGHYWAFGAATTHVGYTLRIEDLQTGIVWEATNPVGELAQAFADTQAFPCSRR